MKKALLTGLLVLCLLALCACQGEQEHFNVVTNPNQISSGTQQPVTADTADTDYAAYDYDTGAYDPASEEDWGGEDEDTEPETETVDTAQLASAPAEVSRYAGATPVILDPIDKPTPTPAPALATPEYQTYDATRLRLSFDGPANWTVDDTKTDAYTITNPDSRVSYAAHMTVTAKAVASEYGQNDLKKEVKTQLNVLKDGFNSFSPTNTATRSLFDKTGVYADFSGLTKDTGVKVWGRVHAVTVNKTLVVVTVITPYEYRENYKDILYGKFRHTVKFTK